MRTDRLLVAVALAAWLGAALGVTKAALIAVSIVLVLALVAFWLVKRWSSLDLNAGWLSLLAVVLCVCAFASATRLEANSHNAVAALGRGEFTTRAIFVLASDPVAIRDDAGHVLVENSLEDAVAILEVVMGGRLVALAGGDIDVVQGDAVDALLGKHALGHRDNTGSRRCALRRG